MEELLTKLRELGVRIPQDAQNWDDTQLTNYAKVLCPYTMTVEDNQDGMYLAYTKASDKLIHSSSKAEAAYSLLYLQLQEGKYTVADTRYKADAIYRATNK